MRKLLESRYFHTVLGLIVSVALIIFVVFSVDDWGQVWLYLGKAKLWVLIPSLLATLLHFTFRALRWRYLLPAEERLSFRQLFDPIMVGAFATFFLPLRAGEFVRPYLLARSSRYTFSSAFVSVVVERFFDLAMVLLSFGVMIMFVPAIPEWVSVGAGMLAGLAAAILLFLIIGALLPGPIEKLIDLVVRPLPQGLSRLAQRFLKDFLGGALVLRNPANLFWVVFLSAMVWLSCYLQFYIYCFFFDLPASFSMAVCVAVIVALAVAAPSAPGFLGVYQTACIAGFALFGVQEELAVAYSIVTHLFQYMLFAVYGIVFLLRNNLRFADLRKAAAER